MINEENRADNLLIKAAALFKERNAVYGDNYKMVGAVMAALFPNGLEVKTVDDWNRLHILLLGVVKDTRYTVNWATGHPDSIGDRTVYSAMLDMIDREIAAEALLNPRHTLDKTDIKIGVLLKPNEIIAQLLGAARSSPMADEDRAYRWAAEWIAKQYGYDIKDFDYPKKWFDK